MLSHGKGKEGRLVEKGKVREKNKRKRRKNKRKEKK